MLYTAVTNDWGETTYIPTPLGNVLLVIILAALLAAAVLFARMQMKKTAAAPASSDGDSRMKHGKLTVKQLAFCAMAIALGTVLSNIKLFHFPTGGSITLLSMLVICLPGYWFGLCADDLADYEFYRKKDVSGAGGRRVGGGRTGERRAGSGRAGGRGFGRRT